MPKPADTAPPGKKYFHTGIGGRGNYNRHGRAAKEEAAAAAAAASQAAQAAQASPSTALPPPSASAQVYQKPLDAKPSSRSSMTASSTASTASLPLASATTAAASSLPSTQPPSYKTAIAAITSTTKAGKAGKSKAPNTLSPTKAPNTLSSQASRTILSAAPSTANYPTGPSAPFPSVKRPNHSPSASAAPLLSSANPDIPLPLNVPSRHPPSTPVAPPPSQHALFAFDEEIERVARARGGGKLNGTPPASAAAAAVATTTSASTLPPTYYAGLSMAASGASVDGVGSGRLGSSGGVMASKATSSLGAGMSAGMGTHGVAGRPHGTPGHVPSSACAACMPTEKEAKDREGKGVKGYLERVGKRNGPGRWVAKVGGIGGQ